MTASGTGIAMAAQGRRTAVVDSPERFQLLKAEARSVPVEEAAALRVKDIGHLHGRRDHLSRRRNRRSLLARSESSRVSKGLETEFRCRCDRCR
jgi:hypothetical protein